MKVFLNILKTGLLCVSLYTLLEELIFYHFVNLQLLLMASALFVALHLRNETPYLIRLNNVRSEPTLSGFRRLPEAISFQT